MVTPKLGEPLTREIRSFLAFVGSSRAADDVLGLNVHRSVASAVLASSPPGPEDPVTQVVLLRRASGWKAVWASEIALPDERPSYGSGSVDDGFRVTSNLGRAPGDARRAALRFGEDIVDVTLHGGLYHLEA